MKSSTRSSGRRGEKGIAVLAAALLVVIMAMAALVVDGGIALMGRTDASIAVDLAAIGGAQSLPDQTAARIEALNLVDLNLNRGVYPVTVPTITFPASNVIRVQADMDLSASFLRVLGLNTVSVGAVAEATRFDPDIALIIDRSGSMCRDSHGLSDICPNDGVPWEPFTTIQGIASSFVTQLGGDPTMALVSYSTTATLDVPPTNNRAQIQAGINALTPGGFTDIASSVTMAIDQVLLTLGSNPKVIVLLTDGVPNYMNGVEVAPEVAGQALVDAANYAFSQGVMIQGINYGDAAFVNNELMQQVTQATEGAFYYAPDAAGLQAVYTDIANRALVRLTYVN